MAETADQESSDFSSAATKPASWATLAIAGIAQMLVMLDSTVVNVALPSIGDDLGTSAIALQWTISGYVLTYGSLLLFGGRLADSIGRRSAFVLGLAVFGAASAACGFATNDAMLVASRIAQGAGAALLSAAALSIIVATYGAKPAQFSIALTAWSGLGVIGATIGVILGGVIVQALSWQWAFFINIPIVAAVAGASYLRLRPMRSATRQSLRLPIALVATLGVGLICYGLSRFEDGLSAALPWILLALGVAILVALFRFEDRSDDPLLPVSLLRTPIYAWSGFGLILAATSMLGALYLSSNYLQLAQGMSPLATGFALVPLCAGSLLSALVIPPIAAKVGMANVYIGGVITQLAALGALIAGTATGTGNSALVISALAVFGLGLPTMFVPLYTFGSAPIPPDKAGVGSGLLNTFNEAGAGVGLAVVSPLAAAVIATQLAVGQTVPEASAAGTNMGYWTLAVIACLALITAVVLSRLTSRSAKEPS